MSLKEMCTHTENKLSISSAAFVVTSILLGWLIVISPYLGLGLLLTLIYWWIFYVQRHWGIIILCGTVVYSRLPLQLVSVYVPLGYLVLFVPFIFEYCSRVIYRQYAVLKDILFFLSSSFLILLCIYVSLNPYGLKLSLKGLEDGYKFIFLFLVGYLANIRQDKLWFTFKAVIFIWLSVAFMGCAEYFFLKNYFYKTFGIENLVPKEYLGIGNGVDWLPIRNYSIVLNPIATGYISMAVSFFFLAQYAEQGRFGTLNLVFFLVSVLSVIVSFTRSAWLGLLAGFIGVIVVGKKKLTLLRFGTVSVFLGGVTVALLFRSILADLLSYLKITVSLEEKSAGSHLMFLAEGLNRALANPFGLGIGTSVDFTLKHPKQVWNESLYFYLLTEIGIFGLLMYITWVSVILSKLLRVYYRTVGTRNQRVMGLFLISTFIAAHLAGVFIPVWYDETFTYPLWILIGAYLGSHNIALAARNGVST